MFKNQKIDLLLLFILISHACIGQLRFVGYVGYCQNQLSPSIKSSKVAKDDGRVFFPNETPALAIGCQFDTIEIKKIKIIQRMLIGVEFINMDIQKLLIFAGQLQRIQYDATYKESFINLKFTPKISLKNRFSIGPSVILGYRINAKTGDLINKEALVRFGFLSTTAENKIHPFQARLGLETGANFIKKKLEIGIEESYSLLNSVSVKVDSELIYYRYFSIGLFLTYNF